MSQSVVWFKKDLRVHDHAALTAAVKRNTTNLQLKVCVISMSRLNALEVNYTL